MSYSNPSAQPLKPPSSALTSLCVLALCRCPLTAAQVKKLFSAGLSVDSDSALLNAEGFIVAYTQMAEIRFGGSNANRAVIADAARDEAKKWRSEIERRAAARRETPGSR